MFLSLDDAQWPNNNLDPFDAKAKQVKTDYYRRLIDDDNSYLRFHIFLLFFSKAMELLGAENFTCAYNFLHDQHKKQSKDPARTDQIILSGLEALSLDSHACTLINELVLHECLNELNERTEPF